MLKKPFILLLPLYLTLISGCAVNPLTGEEEFMFLGPEQDLEIGRKYAPEVEKQMGGKIDNEALQSYLDQVGKRLVRVSHKPDLDFHFTALRDNSVNAMALPGGYIFITKGMLEKLDSEAQLASILGHEMAHVVARDSAAAMSREIGIGLLLSAVTSEQTSAGVLTIADLARQILSLSYSRKDERQADIAGIEYMFEAGYNPYGMIETMQMLENEQKFRPIEFFSTHPLPENRMAYLTAKIQSSYYGLSGLRIGEEDYRRSVKEGLKD